MIAATVNFDTMFRGDWKTAAGISAAWGMLRDGWKRCAGFEDSYDLKTRFLEFCANGARRQMWNTEQNQETQIRKVYRLSRQRLIHVLKQHPELCDAAIGYWCCEAGDDAKAKIEARGLKCPAEPEDPESPFGLFQLGLPTSDDNVCDKFRAISENEEVNGQKGDITTGCDDEQFTTKAKCEEENHFWTDITYSYYNNAKTESKLEGFLQEDVDGDKKYCSMAEHERTGFIRTEEIFKIFTRIFHNSPAVTLATSCTVTMLTPDSAAGVAKRIEVATKTSGNAIENVACTLAPTKTFDKVVVAASMGTLPLFTEVDAKLEMHLMGFKGYGLMGDPEGGTEDVPADDKGRAVHYIDHGHEFQAAYGRTTDARKVKIWGGHDAAVDGEWEGPFEFANAKGLDHIFKEGPACAQDLLGSNKTKRDTGMRPVPSLGQVAILKRYKHDVDYTKDDKDEWKNLWVNTGYGYNGFDLAWFSSHCIAEWVATDDRTKLSPECVAATSEDKETSLWIGSYLILLLLVVVLMVLTTVYCVCYPLCYCCGKFESLDCCPRCTDCCWSCCYPKCRFCTSCGLPRPTRKASNADADPNTEGKEMTEVVTYENKGSTESSTDAGGESGEGKKDSQHETVQDAVTVSAAEKQFDPRTKSFACCCAVMLLIVLVGLVVFALFWAGSKYLTQSLSIF